MDNKLYSNFIIFYLCSYNNTVLNYYIGLAILFIIIILFILSKKFKRRTPKRKTFISDLKMPKFNVNFQKYKKNVVYFKYINKINNEDQYLTWRYTGKDIHDKDKYNLILLPYKNKQNEFVIHYDETPYLVPFFLRYNLCTPGVIEQLSKLLFITSDYNTNKDQYLELEKSDSGSFIIKASIWFERGTSAYLHVDDKNRLYFQNDIDDTIAEFVLE
jgi:hypothetical protein